MVPTHSHQNHGSNQAQQEKALLGANICQAPATPLGCWSAHMLSSVENGSAVNNTSSLEQYVIRQQSATLMTTTQQHVTGCQVQKLKKS